jgi:hypothetical protein
MSLQTNLISNKKAVSVMIAYVLLITMAVVMAGILYNWMKTYVPKDTISCPDGVSVFIENIECGGVPGNYTLNITIVNNGRFDVGGYFAHASNDSSQGIATLDLSKYNPESVKTGGIVAFGMMQQNSFNPSDTRSFRFDEIPYPVEFVEIMPVRWEEVENKIRLATCSDSKIKKNVVCE